MVQQEQQAPIGHFKWQRPHTPYEKFMDAQQIPIVRGLGIRDCRDVSLVPWERMGGKGAFIELSGAGGLTGMYLIEVPAGGSLKAERHMYEELFYVLEGRGSTEVWAEGESRKQTFEWQAGSTFSPPLNTWHQLVNAASSPALLLAATNAPPVFELYRNDSFIFDTPFNFQDRFDGDGDYFKSGRDLVKDPQSGRNRNPNNLIPDAADCELPLDGQRGAGHRHFFVQMSGNVFNGFIAQYPSGRYSKCHAHESGPILLCLSGKGYTITWPMSATSRPWEAGNGDLVQRQDYVPGGLVSAAPGDANWFHGHFGASKEPLRVMAFLGGYPRRVAGAPGDEVIGMNTDLREGGTTIEYRNEDPYIRQMFKETLANVGAEFDMPDSVYQ